MSEEMQPIDPVTAALLMGQVPDPCEPTTEISHKVLTRLMDVVEFGDQLERVEKDRLLAHLKEVLAADQPVLWAMHSPGPGEVHPMISKEEAERQQSELLALCKKQFPAIDITVNVIPSPYSPAEHFELLAEELTEQVANLRQAVATGSTPAPVGAMPPEISRALLGKIVDELFGGAIEDPSAIKDVYRVIAREHRTAPAFVNPRFTPAAIDVLLERQRQVDKEGWTPEHDDEHDSGELAAAGAAYALHAADHLHPHSQGDGRNEAPIFWPWQNGVCGRGEGPEKTEPAWWKPGTPRRDLVKAGALILAEIERLDRASKSSQQEVSSHG